ncbi:MAG TPA: polyprenyl synthetase family protein [Thermoanaerobaculia bacterium]|nr:polyprenyl synthetase family protein [Thermoanaerobaculia bacterium]
MAAPPLSPALSRLLGEVRAAVDARLPALLEAEEPGKDPGDPLPSAVRQALFSPGKRVRPVLVVLAGELFGVARPRLVDAGCAVEMVHAASLVLDDLPSMDDATLRRGRPALHVACGEANAILAAVTLLTRAFGLLAEAGLHARRGGLPASAALDLVSRLADASGLSGLASGQALDLATDAASATFDRLETIHARKTGALFVASAEFGAVLGGAHEKQLAAVRSYARNVGLAFQIVDDLLEGAPAAESGKSARRAPAPTFVRHVGAGGARSLVAELTQHALDSLETFGKKANLLREFAVMLRDRKN